MASIRSSPPPAPRISFKSSCVGTNLMPRSFTSSATRALGTSPCNKLRISALPSPLELVGSAGGALGEEGVR